MPSHLMSSSLQAKHSSIPLSAVFEFKLPGIGSSVVLSRLLRSYEIAKPRSSLVPPWDLDLLLKYLCSETFEPLHLQNLRTLTIKTLFLVALATAKRVGELQALSNIVSESGRDLVLAYLPHFIAKTESASNPLPRTFCLCSLEEFAHGFDEVIVVSSEGSTFVFKENKRIVTKGFHIVSFPSLSH